MWFEGVCELTWRRADKKEQAAINERWGRSSCPNALIPILDDKPFYEWPTSKSIVSGPDGKTITLSNDFGIYEVISVGADCAPERKALKIRACKQKNTINQALADIGQSPDYYRGSTSLTLYHAATSGSGNGHELYDKIKKGDVIYYSIHNRVFSHKVIDIKYSKYSTHPGNFKDLYLDTKTSVDLDQDHYIYLFENNLEEGCESDEDACCLERSSPWRNVYYKGTLGVNTVLYADLYSTKPAKLTWLTDNSYYQIQGVEGKRQWVDIKASITGQWTQKEAWENAKRLVRQIDDCKKCEKIEEEKEECEEVKWTWINLKPRWIKSSDDLWDCVLKADDIKIESPTNSNNVKFWVTARHSTYQVNNITPDIYCEGYGETTGEGFIATKVELLNGINLTKKDKVLSNNEAFHKHYLDCLDKDNQTKGYWQILVKPFYDCHSSCKKYDTLSDESWGQSACPCIENGKVTYSTNTSGLCECSREDISIYATDALVNCQGIDTPTIQGTPTPTLTPTPTPTPTSPEGEWICFECDGASVSTKRGFSSKSLCEEACPQDSGADSHECLFEGAGFSYDYICAEPTPTPKVYHACCVAKKCSDGSGINLYIEGQRRPKQDKVYKLDNGEYVKEIQAAYFLVSTPTLNVLSDLGNYWDDCESLCSKEIKDVSHNEHHIKKHGGVYIQKDMHHRKHFDGSAYFDGQGDYLSIPKNDDFKLGVENFTIECWFYIETLQNSWMPQPGAVGLISSMGDATSGSGQGDNGWVLGYYENGTIGFHAFANESTTVLSLSSQSQVEEKKWYHIAAQRNGSSAMLWLNGELVDSETIYCAKDPCIIGHDISYNHDLSIGRFYSDYDSYYHKGYINEVRISNKARYINEFKDKINDLEPFFNDKKTRLLIHFDCVKPTGGFPSQGLTNHFPMDGEVSIKGGLLGGSGGSIQTG